MHKFISVLKFFQKKSNFFIQVIANMKRDGNFILGQIMARKSGKGGATPLSHLNVFPTSCCSIQGKGIHFLLDGVVST